jgi:hypothetical protein
VTQLQALLLSIALEVPVVLLLARLLGVEAPLPRLLLTACAATLVTHPFAWHGFRELSGLFPNYWVKAGVIEGAVAVVEGLLYWRVAGAGFGRGQALGWTSNAFSYGVGLLIFRLVLR